MAAASAVAHRRLTAENFIREVSPHLPAKVYVIFYQQMFEAHLVYVCVKNQNIQFYVWAKDPIIVDDHFFIGYIPEEKQEYKLFSMASWIATCYCAGDIQRQNNCKYCRGFKRARVQILCADNSFRMFSDVFINRPKEYWSITCLPKQETIPLPSKLDARNAINGRGFIHGKQVIREEKTKKKCPTTRVKTKKPPRTRRQPVRKTARKTTRQTVCKRRKYMNDYDEDYNEDSSDNNDSSDSNSSDNNTGDDDCHNIFCNNATPVFPLIPHLAEDEIKAVAAGAAEDARQQVSPSLLLFRSATTITDGWETLEHHVPSTLTPKNNNNTETETDDNFFLKPFNSPQLFQQPSFSEDLLCCLEEK